jgi:protease-4
MPQQVAYVAVPQKKGKGWIVALVAVLCFFALAAFGVKSCSDAMANGGMYGSTVSPSGDTVAIIDIDSTIQYDGTACSPEGFKTLLDKAEDNSNIKAVVLRVNSGGGTATAGEEMAEYLRDFNKPVVVSSASINASAAYEISSQADYIFVAKSTEIGAIGTAMQLTDLSGLLDMLGINVDVITSSDSKDSSYGYRPLTDEEREYYQHMINEINDMFIENVATGRKMDIEEVRKLATGLSFTGVDAVENGLADEVGTLEDAMDKAAELAGISSYDSYHLYLSNYDFTSLYSLLGSQQREFTIEIPGMKQAITVNVKG